MYSIPIIIETKDCDGGDPIVEVFLCEHSRYPEFRNNMTTYEDRILKIKDEFYKVAPIGNVVKDVAAMRRLEEEERVLKREFKKMLLMTCVLASDYDVLDEEFYGLD